MENARKFLAKWFAIVASALLGVIVTTYPLGRLFGSDIATYVVSCIFVVALVIFLFKWKDVRWQQPLAMYGALVMTPLLIIGWARYGIYSTTDWIRIVATIVAIAFTAWGIWKIWGEKNETRPFLPMITLVATTTLYTIFFPSAPESYGYIEIIQLARYFILIPSYLALVYFAYRLLMNHVGKLNIDEDNKFIAIVGLSYSILVLLLTYIFVSPMRATPVSLLIRLVLLLIIAIGYNLYVCHNKTNSTVIMDSAAIISSLSLFQLYVTSIYDLAPLYLFGIVLVAWIHYCRIAYNWGEKLRNTPQLAMQVVIIALVAIGLLVLIIRTAILIQQAHNDGFGVAGYRTFIIIAAVLLALAIVFTILVALNKVAITGIDKKVTAKYVNIAAVALFVISLATSDIIIHAKYSSLNDKINAEAQARNMEGNRLRAGNRLKGDDIENTHWKGSWVNNIPAYFAFKENGIVIAQFGNKQRTGTYTQHGRYVTVAINGGEGTLNFSLNGDKLNLYMTEGNRTERYTFTQY